MLVERASPGGATNRLAHFAGFTTLFTVAVILWGAFVRATLSGDGCGDSWPDCGGHIGPSSSQTSTRIEWVHRLTSGLDLLLIAALFVWVRVKVPRAQNPAARRCAALSLALIVVEALLGAGLVLLRLVALNPAPARVVWVSVHLLNTFLLLGALTLTAYHLHHRARPIIDMTPRSRKTPRRYLVALAAVLVVAITGAVTALADTLFPSPGGLREIMQGSKPWLVRLRVIHPALATAVTTYLFILMRKTLREEDGTSTFRAAHVGVLTLVVLQMTVGVLNIVTQTPVALQLTHLALADALWVALTLCAVTASESPNVLSAAYAFSTPSRGRTPLGSQECNDASYAQSGSRSDSRP